MTTYYEDLSITTQPQWINPFKDDKHFLSLGRYNYEVVTRGKIKTVRSDLYCTSYEEGVYRPYVDFGARYSNNFNDFVKGRAVWHKDKLEWVLDVGSKEVALAAARYFANYHRS